MPHHLIGRLRSWPLSCLGDLEKAGGRGGRKRDGAVACVIECLDILGGLVFLVGSVCFLPAISRKLVVFLAGCALFIVGGAIYAAISTFTLIEAVRDGGWHTLESCENALYLVGSLIFLAGTVLYWPEEAHYRNIDWIKDFSLGVYFNLFTPEFEGTLLFIVGSLLFAMAAFVNGLNQDQTAKHVDGSATNFFSGLFAASTSLYMAGSLLFVVGSVAFLPDLECSEQMIAVGAWCYIAGSAMYVAGGCISLRRVVRQLRETSSESEALLSKGTM